MSWLFLILAIVSEVAATMSLRASEGFTKKLWAIPIVIGYVLAFGFISLALSTGLPLGVAYGIWVAAGVAITAVLARFIFHEPLTPTMAIGILLIAMGVMTVELGASAAH